MDSLDRLSTHATRWDVPLPRAAAVRFLPVLLLALLGCAAPLDRATGTGRPAEAEAAIRTLLAEQAASWSRGDVEEFVSAYAEDALFVSPSGLTRGRDEVLGRYRRRYPDPAAMGRLSLDVIELRLTPGGVAPGPGCGAAGEVHGARVVARWTLGYPEDAEREEATGLTLIVFERRGGEWWIVEDASM